MKRGIVSLPLALNSLPGGFYINGGITQLDLNFFALYWDELLIPYSRIHYFGIENEDLYIKAGFLKRPEIPLLKNQYTDSDAIPMNLWAQTYFLDLKRQEEKDSDWRLNQIGDSLCLNNSTSDKVKGLRIELSNVLPVPDLSVSINDILEFKLKRRDEINAFNNYLDELYLEVLNSGDFYLSKAKAFSKLKSAIDDLEKLNAEGWRSPIKFDTSEVFEANNQDIISGISALYAIWEANNGNIAATISAGITAALGQGFARLKPTLQSVRRKPGVNMAYLSSAHKAGIVK
ncbi:hypothetical protein BANRA_01986 [Klebsiella quasipneumoniae]|uniref:DUF6236 family protein n=1 Tax=Klebsiella quasipneumoniae TaxID=1463165 RepID=UPI000F1DFD5E|nr:DUF6236 family protein [Klebsiella quasipneumoniae]VDA30276.1 hypothetical protein BANRA_01986 [Klebsiella quasipneumoniae]HBR2006985.1 hypothetical protein [Klebsiella pneumoniae]HDU5431909.1 hypothetical protein [Klebsiella pneumoniae subsp. pneumoniae]